jgi:pimeloyl-ACP methyl ester carboxylesterase
MIASTPSTLLARAGILDRSSTHLDLLDAHLDVAVEHRMLDRDWGTQHVVVTEGNDSGPVVLLLHGWPQHWFAWRHVIDGLHRRGVKVVAIDVRDFGWSRSDGRRAPTITELAGDITATLDDLELDEVVLAAHDWGGWIGFEAALDSPGRFRHYSALAIVPPWLSWQAMVRNVSGWGYVFPMAAIGARIARNQAAVRFLLDHSAEGPVWDRADNQLALASYLDRIVTPHAAAMTQHLYRLLVGRELPRACGPRCRFLEVPATVLVGQAETIAKPELYLPRTRPGELAVQVVPGVRHWLAEEAPTAVVEHLATVAAAR